MKHAIFCALAVCVGILICQPSSATEIEEEDKLLAVARASHEDPSIPGINSEIERRALAAAGNVARRDGGNLILKTSITTDTFIDGPNCKDIEKERDCGIVKLIAYAKSRRLFVLLHSWYGGNAYILLDGASAAETNFGELPYLSPTGDFVVGTNLSQVRNGDDKHSNLEISMRFARGVYLTDDEPSIHYPDRMGARYVIEEWLNDDPKVPTDKRVIELVGHLEGDGKPKARVKLRRMPPDKGYEIMDIP